MDASPEGEVKSGSEPGSLSPAERFDRLIMLTKDISLVGVAQGPEFTSIIQQHFQRGGSDYDQLTDRKSSDPYLYASIHGDSGGGGRANVSRVLGPGEYLENVRGHRFAAILDMGELEKERQRYGTGMGEIHQQAHHTRWREDIRNLVAAFSQLRGAAEEALKRENVYEALMLFEAAGDFGPPEANINPEVLGKLEVKVQEGSVELKRDFHRGITEVSVRREETERWLAGNPAVSIVVPYSKTYVSSHLTEDSIPSS